MKNMNSLTRLRLKIVGGYVSLISLFIIASVIVVCKSGNLEENSKRYSYLAHKFSVCLQAKVQIKAESAKLPA